MHADGEQPSRREEVVSFLTLTFVVAPGLTVAGIGLVGLTIWLAQTFFIGPPTG